MKERSLKTALPMVALMLAVIGIAFTCLAGCSKADPPVQEGLPSWIGEDAIAVHADEVIDDALARNYAAVADRFADEGVTAEQLDKSLSETFVQLGTFKDYTDASYLQGESKGRPYATISQGVAFENGNGEFRISFFEDGSLAGFYFVKAA